MLVTVFYSVKVTNVTKKVVPPVAFGISSEAPINCIIYYDSRSNDLIQVSFIPISIGIRVTYEYTA